MAIPIFFVIVLNTASIGKAGAAGTATRVKDWLAARANGAAGLGSAAIGRGANRPTGRQELGIDPEDGVADQSEISASGLGTSIVRATAAG